MNRGVTSIFCASMMILMLASSVNYNEQLSTQDIVQEISEKNSYSNQSKGGYHIATGEWWEPSRPYNVTTNDWDGDGNANGVDTHPLDPALYDGYRIKGTACTNLIEPCKNDPMQAPFRSEPVIVNPLGTHSLAVEWGDVNSDGSLDLVVGNSGSPNELYLNDGINLQSIPKWVSPNSHVTMDIGLGDVDGDGDLDLAEINYEGPAQIYRNVNGIFERSPFWSYTFGNNDADSTMTSLAWGDVDNDGDLDLMVGIYYEGIELFLNNGGTLSSNPSWVRSTDRATLDIELSDLNNDGFLDLIEGAAGQKNHVYMNSASGFSTTPYWQSVESYPTSSISLGDVDGDGDNDLVVGNRNEVNELFINSGNWATSPGFTTSATWASQNTSLTMDVKLADVDKDGDLDILDSTANEPDYIHTFNGQYYYGMRDTWASNEERDSAYSAWGDVDGDGDLDFATADGIDGPILYINGGHHLDDVNYWNDGTNSWSWSIDLGDMDRDGDLDLAVGNAYGTDSVVYKNGYDTFGYNTFSLDWTSPGTKSFHAEDILWFDVDNDGNLDLIIGDNNGRNYAYEGSINGLPQGNPASPLWRSQNAYDTYDLIAGDINGDGWNDLVSVNAGYNTVHYAVNTPNAYFLDQQDSWTSYDNDYSVCGALGDVNGDGHLDLFVANYYEYAKLYINTGTGLETTASWTSQSTVDAQGCALGDIDGDGDLDAVLSTETTTNNLYLNNNGALSRSPDWVTPESYDTMSIILRDVDGDNDLDWVEGNYGPKNRIRMNVNGTFDETIWQSTDSLDTWYLDMADIDGDGDLDMAVANEQQNNQIFMSYTDQDGDWVTEENDGDTAPFDPTQTSDSDNDGFGDRNLGWRPDGCPNYWGDSWRERWGCPDLDRDGQSDLFDPFMQDDTQWSDADGDGLGDNWNDPSISLYRENRGLGEFIENASIPDPSPWDYDNDGFEDEHIDGSISPYDDCPYQLGTSYIDRFGCADADTDGHSDEGDAFPGDHTQWNDSDDDGFGDSSRGNQPDNCVNVAGTSTDDVFGCPDSDGDGWSDGGDFNPDNPAVWSDGDDDGFDDQLSDGCLNEKGGSTEDRGGCKDHDRDGYSDPDSDSQAHPNGEADAFPFEGTQWRNQDGDSYGDNQIGFQPDSCIETYGTSQFKITNGEIEDWYGCSDQDNDGLYDGDDQCPLVGGTSSLDRYGCPDSDNDGMSDLNDDCELQAGDSTIEFIACPDTDGDGIPDSIDPEPSDGIGSADDWDADGWNQENDAFPNDSTQWEDGDGDGLGDNPDGNNPDPLPGDKDNDGWPDSNDAFINNPNEWIDTDGDGIGDNTDDDDDGDGYSDILEEQVGTDPKDVNSHTIESWELMIPGTRIALSWWDLLGVIAGIPLASWLGFGLVTRNKRVAKFEDELGQATTKEGIEEIAIRAEKSLMLRLIGPHQAIRLERLRAELDDALDAEGFPITSEQTEIVLDDMEQIHEEAFVPEIPNSSINYQITERDGYEWKNEDGKFHYRDKDGDGVWHPWGE